MTAVRGIDLISSRVDDRLEMAIVRREGGSWATRVAALALVCGFVGLTLVAAWQIITMPFGWALLAWTVGLLAGALATPAVLRLAYEVTVLRTWRRDLPMVEAAADNRRWWLRQYAMTLNRPYGILAVVAAIAWRLSAAGRPPLQWQWCLLIILGSGFFVLAFAGIPKDPEMPHLKSCRVRLLPVALALGIFVGARFVDLAWLQTLLFFGALLTVTPWAAFATVGAAQLFLRIDRGQSASYPMD